MSVIMQVASKKGLGAQTVRSDSQLGRFDWAGTVTPVSWDARNARMLGTPARAHRRDISPMIIHFLVVATTMFLFWDLYLLAAHVPR